MIRKTLGGDRLGSGNRLKAELHNYERSTHDLSTVWRSSMAPGVLVPCLKQISHDGDTYTINTRELVRTIPAVGPCFGSYKLQIDFFEVPIRLYNGILHNNLTKIGLDMQYVYLPTVTYRTTDYGPNLIRTNPKTYQVNPSSLTAYLGIRGIGENSVPEKKVLERDFNAVPMLAYYDIFKNYYANKQEENAYVINTKLANLRTTNLRNLRCTNDWEGEGENVEIYQTHVDSYDNTDYNVCSIRYHNESINWIAKNMGDADEPLLRKAPTYYTMRFDGNVNMGPSNNVAIRLKFSSPEGSYTWNIPSEYGEEVIVNEQNKVIEIMLSQDAIQSFINDCGWVGGHLSALSLKEVWFVRETNEETEIELTPFRLIAIDQMRIFLLQQQELGAPLNINQLGLLPFIANYGYNDEVNESYCKYPMQGLVVKTYQSDLFNAWLSKKWIDGIQGINTISAIAVEEGKIEVNAINLAKKVYNMLNRIAVSGGTYEDWREAVYGDNAIRRTESPVYCGGASGIIAFEEIVSTADTETTNAGDQPLGSMAGKGVLTNIKGGEIEIHVNEPSYIMAIASITPLIDYSNGNDFDVTEIRTLDDLHKPELDEIGFQDLILERAAWWTTKYDEESEKWRKESGGKVPAWIEWMTNYNRVYGNFAEEMELDFMTLQRRYEKGTGSDNNAWKMEGTDPLSTVSIKDWTTYINPTKFNYQFADADLNAQNFWVQIAFDITVRRKISAKLIPNL